MLKELKRRHYEHVKEQFELGEEEDGHKLVAGEEDERLEEIIEEPKVKKKSNIE